MQHDESKDNDQSDEEEQLVDSITVDESLSRGSSQTLLSVLDDKNRAIEVLQRQLQNQKLQLGYYIRNAIKSSKIIQLSKTCEPDAVDGNIPLTLAISNFYKQTGMKSRLMSLYERMTAIDGQIQVIVSRQECLLLEIVEKVIGQSFKGANIHTLNNKSCLTQIFSNREQFEMLNEIFHATISLKNELDRYRLCCNRLIVVEDERNALVEQVYSLPVEERVRCNYIMVVQMEKNHLEKEMKDIRREQKQLQVKLRQLQNIENGLREAQMNGDYGDDNFGTQLIDMLESVRSDAYALLSISKSQKSRYNNELAKLTLENKALEQEVKKLQEEMCEENKSRKSGGDTYKNTSQKGFCEERYKLIEDLSTELQTKTDENNSLIQTIKELRNEIQELETVRLNLEDVENLKRERDNYKSQVEDLEAIRTAYSQLVEHHPNTEAELVAKEKKIEDLETQRDNLQSEIVRAKRANALQESQIKHLLRIIDKFGEYKEIEAESTAKMETCVQYDNTDYQSEPVKCARNKDQIECLSNSSSAVKSSLKPHQLSCPVITQSCNNSETINLHQTTNLNDITVGEISKKNSCAVETSDSLQKNIPLLSTTTFEVQRTDKHGKVETMKAVLESTSSVQGIIHLENANNLSLEVKCKKKHKGNSKANVVDEYELMKDCSEETIPNICGPYQCYQCYEKKECVKNYRDDKIDIFEVRKKETYEIVDENEEDFDVIEYKKAPHGQDDFGSCWGDSSSSSGEMLCTKSTSINGDSPRDTKHFQNLSTVPENSEGEQNNSKDEQSFNHLICINKSLKLITSSLDSVLKKPGGKASVINTLHEMYKSLFPKHKI